MARTAGSQKDTDYYRGALSDGSSGQGGTQREKRYSGLGSLAAFDEDLVPVQIDIPNFDAHQFTDTNRCVEEQLEHDLVLHVAAILDDVEEAFQFRFRSTAEGAVFLASISAGPASGPEVTSRQTFENPKSVRFRQLFVVSSMYARRGVSNAAESASARQTLRRMDRSMTTARLPDELLDADPSITGEKVCFTK